MCSARRAAGAARSAKVRTRRLPRRFLVRRKTRARWRGSVRRDDADGLSDDALQGLNGLGDRLTVSSLLNPREDVLKRAHGLPMQFEGRRGLLGAFRQRFG